MCSPRLLKSAGRPRRAADLLKLPLIGRRDWWRLWFEAAGVPDVDLSDRPNLDMGVQQYEVASATEGHGVAIGSPVLFAREIDSGALVRPFGVLATDGRDHWLVYARARRRAAKVLAFRNWLLDEAKAVVASHDSSPPIVKRIQNKQER